MSFNKNYKRGELVRTWLNPPGAGKFDNTKIIALIIHVREGESVVDVLCDEGIKTIHMMDISSKIMTPDKQ